MANSKKSTPKTKKVRATKYTKLAVHVTKELNAKKKALVAAEKRLGKAQETHQELLSEVARLDMLDRSLKAVNEKTTPPQNIKYVYTYPQWVWNPGYTYTVPNYQPQWTFTNVPNLPNGGTFLTNGSAVGGDSQNGTTGGVYNSTVTCTLSNSGPGGIVTSNNDSLPTLNGVNTGLSGGQTAMLASSLVAPWESSTSYENGTMVVDLTTHAEPETEADITAELVAKAG